MVLDASGVAKEFMTAYDIAKILNISYPSALRLIKEELPHLKIGKIYRVRKIEFDKWMKREMRE